MTNGIPGAPDPVAGPNVMVSSKTQDVGPNLRQALVLSPQIQFDCGNIVDNGNSIPL